MGSCIILIGLLLFRAAQAPKPQDTPAPSPLHVARTEKQFSFYPGGKLMVSAEVPGNVTIIGWGRSSILMEAEQIIHNLPENQSKALSDQYPVQVRWTQTTATIRTQGPPELAATVKVNVTLHVPKEKTDINIHLLRGDLAVGSINGWVEATLGEGRIEAKSLQGYFSAITQKGDLNIELSGKRWEGFGLTAATKDGSAQLRLPLDYSAALQLETRDGNISIQYPEQPVEGERVPLNVVTQKNARSLTATVGAGGSPIKLLTTAGDIHMSGVGP